jgi:hypothetical protein
MKEKTPMVKMTTILITIMITIMITITMITTRISMMRLILNFYNQISCYRIIQNSSISISIKQIWFIEAKSIRNDGVRDG